MGRTAEVTRETNETAITVSLVMDEVREPKVSTTLPFLDHVLASCAFHGGFGLVIQASGDTEVDPHHLVEDTGIVLGSCFDQILRDGGPVNRFGHAVMPMDEALSEVTVDVCGRPTVIYRADYPQPYAGSFPLWLFREFFAGFANGAAVALHAECRYGENSHHMVEALFKAFGKALHQAYERSDGQSVGEMSTKGRI
jgi:imidazoleglycerol-phosphate dehydratase